MNDIKTLALCLERFNAVFKQYFSFAVNMIVYRSETFFFFLYFINWSKKFVTVKKWNKTDALGSILLDLPNKLVEK